MERVNPTPAYSSLQSGTGSAPHCPDHPVSVAVEGLSQVIPCRKGETLLGAMQRAGRRCLQVGCRGGGCGVCRVEVLRGSYTETFMSKKMITDEDRESHIVLACCIYPTADMIVRPAGKRDTVRN